MSKLIDITKEYIICAAIWYNEGEIHENQPKNIEIGFVVSGRRHHNCYNTVKILCGIDEAIKLKVENIENRMSREDYKRSQGFITSLDRYVDRYEGMQIAVKVGQVSEDKLLFKNEPSIKGLEMNNPPKYSPLISEELY